MESVLAEGILTEVVGEAPLDLDESHRESLRFMLKINWYGN